MNKFVPIILAALVSLVSCVPMSTTSGISYLPDIKNKFGEDSEYILVLPIWETHPSLAGEGQAGIYVFSEPLFITVNELPNLNKIIPTKTSVALMGIATAVGRLVSIDTVIIISETGKLVTVQCPAETWGMQRCEKFHDDYIYKQWRDDIVRVIKKSSGEVDYPEQAIAELMDTFPKKYKISYSSSDKQLIINFLNEIVYLVDPFEGYSAEGMDKTTGEPCRDSDDCAPGYFCKNHKCKESSIIPPSAYKP